MTAPAPGQAAYTDAELEAAAKAIHTAQNANDDEPEWWEARHLARVALEAARTAAHEQPAPGPLALQLIIAVDALRDIRDSYGTGTAAHDAAHKALDDIGVPGAAEPQPAGAGCGGSTWSEKGQLLIAESRTYGELAGENIRLAAENRILRDLLNEAGIAEPAELGPAAAMAETRRYRDGISTLLADITASADATRPSAKTRAEDELAAQLRQLLEAP